jgi:predicted nucleic acid-binding protein
VILCDTGPLVALIDRRQGEAHDNCRAIVDNLRDTLHTTWPCVTEAMYLAHKIGGWQMQGILWRLLASAAFDFCPIDRSLSARMETLMARYRSVPMDMADASLVVAAERLGVRRIFTLDSDFLIYRFDDGGCFDVIP